MRLTHAQYARTYQRLLLVDATGVKVIHVLLLDTSLIQRAHRISFFNVLCHLLQKNKKQAHTCLAHALYFTYKSADYNIQMKEQEKKINDVTRYFLHMLLSAISSYSIRTRRHNHRAYIVTDKNLCKGTQSQLFSVRH